MANPLTVQQRIEREGQHPEPGDVIVFTLGGFWDDRNQEKVSARVKVVEFRGLDPDYHKTRFYGRYLPEAWDSGEPITGAWFMYGWREILGNGAYVSRADGKPCTVQGEG
jgi:hypothetical protein